jgi:3-hydroxyacyl-[acyl-carrier-protein] dehydratase
VTTVYNLDINAILANLPHRAPFLLIDKVIEMRRPDTLDEDWTGSYVRGLKNVTFNEPFFPGHFPNHPVMPGVLIIECLAQACAMVAAQPRDDGKKWNFYIVSVNNCKFRKPIIPGDQIELFCELKKVRNKSNFVFACQAIVGGEKRAEAEIMAMMF